MQPKSDHASASVMPEKGRFIPNLLSNVTNFICNMFIGIWFTAYLMEKLGASNYGLIPLATTIVSYMAILTLALNSSVGRSLTGYIERNDFQRAIKVFNTSFYASLAMAGLLIIPLVVLSFNADRIIRVPAGSENQAKILFGSVSLAFVINTLATPFGVSAFSRNRLDLGNWISITQNIFRVALVGFLFMFTSPALWQVGAGVILSTTIGLLGNIWLWKKLLPNFSIGRSFFSAEEGKKMLATSAWVTITQLGTVLVLAIDLFVVNRLLGPEQAGRYAPILQWSLLLRTIAGTLSGVFAPTIMALYAADNPDALNDYTGRAIRFVGYAMAIGVGLVCGFAQPLLTIWLGDDFSGMAPLMWLMIGPLCINLAVYPMFSLNLASDQIKGPAIVTLFIGVANLGVALLFAGPFQWGMYGVAAAAVILLSLKNAAYIPIHTAKCMKVSPWLLWSNMIGAVAMTAGVSLLGWMISHFLHIDSWFKIASAGTFVGATALIFIWFIVLRQVERAELISRFGKIGAKFRIPQN